MGNQLRLLDQLETTVLDKAITFGPKLAVAIIILIVGYMIGRWLSGLLERMLQRLKLETSARLLLVRICHITVIILFAIMALQNLGVELLPLIAGVGVAGAGIALAMQGLLGDLFAGFSIIFSQPFLVGHYISIANEEGVVLDIGLFRTTLGHTDHSIVVIPNRKIVGEIFHNYNRIRQVNIAVEVAYGTDVNVALKAANEVLLANPRILQEPAPWIRVTKLGNSGATITVSPWVNAPDYEPAITQINEALLATFKAKEVVIPLQQREVWVHGLGASAAA